MTRRGVGVEATGRLVLVNSTYPSEVADPISNDIFQYLGDKGRIRNAAQGI